MGTEKLLWRRFFRNSLIESQIAVAGTALVEHGRGEIARLECESRVGGRGGKAGADAEQRRHETEVRRQFHDLVG